MVALASMEFDDYPLLWWDKLQVARVENHQQSINNWVEMTEQAFCAQPLHYGLLEEAARAEARAEVS